MIQDGRRAFMEKQTRRSLLHTSFWATLGATVSGLGLGLLNYAWPRRVTGFGADVRVPAESLPHAGAAPLYVREGKFFLVNLSPGDGVPEQFRDLAEPSRAGGLLALYQKCTHLGCDLPWEPEARFQELPGWFKCPCHCSTFTKAGVRVFGPAPRAMDTMELKINPDGSVTVHTSRIRLGGSDNPRRAAR